MEGGGAQESDDITGQPLKDELFPRATPASLLRRVGSRAVGDGGGGVSGSR